MAEDRVSVWEYIGPAGIISAAKDTYVSPYTVPTTAFLYGTYSGLARGKFVIPGILPTNSPIPGVGGAVRASQFYVRSAWEGMTTPAFRSTNLGKWTSGIAKFVLFGDERSMGAGANLVANMGIKGARRHLRGIMTNSAPTIGFTADVGLAGAKKIAREVLGTTRSWSTIGKAAIIRGGRMINPVLNVYMAAEIASFAVETAFKGIRNTTDAINRATASVRDLELGGQLAKPYLMDQAVTERQRALQAIQASHLSGRRFLGSEAQLYHE